VVCKNLDENKNMVKVQGKVVGLELSRWGRIFVRVLFKKTGNLSEFELFANSVKARPALLSL